MRSGEAESGLRFRNGGAGDDNLLHPSLAGATQHRIEFVAKSRVGQVRADVD
jgi:hypothetical protein